MRQALAAAREAQARGEVPIGTCVVSGDKLVALAGNPNTGKSTVFNALTGLRQHTGNWPGKTVTRAEGGFAASGSRFKLVDLPGTYSLLSASHDEQVARDFLLFGRPDVTIVVTDATSLERNLNLVLQVLEITDRVVVAVNLMDEARRRMHVGPAELATNFLPEVLLWPSRRPRLDAARCRSQGGICHVGDRSRWSLAGPRTRRAQALNKDVDVPGRGPTGEPVCTYGWFVQRR